jgi:hypothetical protein
VGDALLAHELAHVGQQGAGAASASEAALEQDADASAAGAVAALWAPEHPAAARLQRRPRLRDGLALRRCTPDKDKKNEKDAAPPAKDAGPEPAPVEPMPANPKQVYDQKLQEAMPKIKALFGRAEKGKFDEDNWEKVDLEKDGKKTGEAELKLRAGRYPSNAITSIIDNPDKWTLDCAQAVQLAHLYALRYALGATEFNKRVGGAAFVFRPHDSTGVEGATEWWRPGLGTKWKRFAVDKAERAKKPDGEDETRSEQQLLDAAPAGSRVMFTNQMADSSAAFHHENSYKLGPDSYAAHGFAGQKVFTRAELSHALAKAFLREEPTQSFVDGNIYIQAIETYKSDLPGGVPAGG